MKVCLTIAGLDPSGGAGIIADIKTFSAFGCFATSAVTSLTFQNTTGVFGAIHQTAESVRGQVEPILQDFDIAALKTGMLPTIEVIEEVSRLVRENNLKNFVVDPVVRSTSGYDLIDDEALKALKKIFPYSVVITPNIPEAERLSGIKIKNEDDIEKATRIIQDLGAKNVLIKGGHLYEKGRLNNEEGKARDFLFEGEKLTIFEAEYYKTTATHGTGCTLAAAIAANLALEKDLKESIENAKNFVNKGIKNAPHLGKGNSPINIEFNYKV